MIGKNEDDEKILKELREPEVIFAKFIKQGYFAIDVPRELK